jgi:hypothetical protein
MYDMCLRHFSHQPEPTTKMQGILKHGNATELLSEPSTLLDDENVSNLTTLNTVRNSFIKNPGTSMVADKRLRKQQRPDKKVRFLGTPDLYAALTSKSNSSEQYQFEPLNLVLDAFGEVGEVIATNDLFMALSSPYPKKELEFFFS